jgi:hypothetical protein
VLLLPIGIAEFTLMVTFWATSLWLVTLPIYWTWLPDSWRPIAWNRPLFEVDTWPATLPWAALGVLVLAMAIALTKALGTVHARYARALLGPSRHRIAKLEKLNTAGTIDWSAEWPQRTESVYRPVTR